MKHYTFRLKGLALALTTTMLFSNTALANTINAAAYENITIESATTTLSEDAIRFTFDETGISASLEVATGYEISGTTLKIKAAGTYVLSGSCTDGSIKVEKGTENVHLIFSNLNLSCQESAPVVFGKNSQVTLELEAGTTNTLADTARNNDEVYTDNTDAENAVIKAKSDSMLTILGTGTLTINGKGKNGIKSASSMSIESGTINVSALNDAIHSDYSLTIGELNSDGPTINVSTSEEALEAANLTINSGNMVLHAADDGINAANSDLTNHAYTLDINGGNITIDCEGDGLDSNGTLTINGGVLTVFSASNGDNQPLDADGEITINGGTILGAGAFGMGGTITGAQAHVEYGISSMGAPQMPGDGPQPGPGDGSQPGPGDGSQPGPGDGSQPGPGDGSQPGPGDGSQPGGNENRLSILANDTISIQNASGTTLYTVTAPRNCEYVVFSNSSVTDGETYSLLINGTSVATETAALTSNNGMDAGGNPPVMQTQLTDTMFTLSTTRFAYTGKNITPDVTANGLTKDTDYTVSYTNNKNVGTATVTITGIGNYTGTITKTFRIVPASTSITKLTKAKAGFSICWKKKTAQTSGYQIQYSTSKTFSTTVITKNVTSTTTTKANISGLKSKKTYYVRVRTYKVINGKKVYSSWSSTKSVTTK